MDESEIQNERDLGKQKLGIIKQKPPEFQNQKNIFVSKSSAQRMNWSIRQENQYDFFAHHTACLTEPF